jgi:hypothetical protein
MAKLKKMGKNRVRLLQADAYVLAVVPGIEPYAYNLTIKVASCFWWLSYTVK